MKFKLLFLILIQAGIFAQYIPIDSVRKQDANGVPLLLGQTVTLRGVVTSSGELGTSLVYFQDPTGGMVAFDQPFNNNTNNGDSVQVTGVVTQYNGLTELQPVNSSSLLASNIPVTPVIVNTNQIRAGGENYEGKLIRINNIIAVKNTSGQPVTQWTVSGSGTNYRIFDGTDSCEIRIYSTTNIGNTQIPQFPFSVVAVNSQFDSSPPYNSGYQILPRSLSDFITTATGPLLSQISYTNIQTNSVTINWSTSANSDSKIRWVFTDSNYQPLVFKDSLFDAAQTLNHSFTISNLRSGSIYMFNVTSSNTSGSTTSNLQYFCTKSTSTGNINVYFNKSVDTTIHTGEKALGDVNFQTKLLQRINAAQYSIDMCLYSYNELPQVTSALINAFVRGVKIRFVYDSRTNQEEVNNLIAAGIPIQKRNNNTSDIMHNKFFVFDHRDTTSANDDWVWTGSTNLTNDQFFTDANNVIEIQDKTLAAIYTREFEEMWGSHGNQPLPAVSRFGPEKLDNVPHFTNINGTSVEVYFSPSDNPSSKIENMINNQTDNCIYFSAFAFTRFNIANRMKSKWDAGKDVKGVFDQGNATDPNSVYKEMKGLGGSVWNPPADVWLDNQPGLLHHKYILIDAVWPNSNPVTETGSFNFSNAATFDNDENFLIIHSPRVTNLYAQEFYRRYKLGGGSGVIGLEQISTELPGDFTLSQNYPNPFNPETKITFKIKMNSGVRLNIYNTLGQNVETLINDQLQSGTYELTFNASHLSSGIYYYSLFIDGLKIDTKKMVLIK
jgi:phosphatidylserine/phosphatidylglycerophosphate/cardiolipin synthase-like enzyme